MKCKGIYFFNDRWTLTLISLFIQIRETPLIASLVTFVDKGKFISSSK